MNKQKRLDALLPNNTPKYVKCYTGSDVRVVFTRKRPKRVLAINPTRLRFFGSRAGTQYLPYEKDLGNSVDFSELPEICKAFVLEEYKYLWGLNTI